MGGHGSREEKWPKAILSSPGQQSIEASVRGEALHHTSPLWDDGRQEGGSLRGCVIPYPHAEASEEAVQGEPERRGEIRLVCLEEQLCVTPAVEAEAGVNAALEGGEA